MAKKQKTKKKIKSSAKTEERTQTGVIPLADRVLIKPLIGADETSPSGIIIPDSARKETPERGIVIAVGEGKRNDRGEVLPLRVKKGDTVIFEKYGFQEVKINDEELYIIAESGILAVIR